MKLTIQKMYTKDGVSTKTGKPYTLISILSDKAWYKCFKNQTTASWKEGDVVEVEVQEKPPYKGQKQFDIVFPKKGATESPAITHEVMRLLISIDKSLKYLVSKQQGVKDELPPFTDDARDYGGDLPSSPIDDDLPF